MKVLALTPALPDTSPGQRFRVEQWARCLAPAGYEFTFVPFEDAALHEILYRPGRYVAKAILTLHALVRRLGWVSRVSAYDVVVLHREAALVGPALIERLLVRRRVPVVYDFDDAVWVPYVSPANRFLSYLKCFSKAAQICRLSTRVVVGNRYLADYARAHARRVDIVPTTIDTVQYRPSSAPAPDRTPRRLAVGWTGSYSTVQHLDLLRRPLSALHRRIPFRLHVIGTPAYRLDGVPVCAQPWSATSEVEDLRGFDIGIMPLPDDPWSRGKCGLKLLQCMALGIPVVGSPVGVNAEIIEDGVNGFLAAGDEEWIDKLSRLMRDPDLRERMGRAGRETVEARYAAAVWAPRFGEILRSAADRA